MPACTFTFNLRSTLLILLALLLATPSGFAQNVRPNDPAIPAGGGSPQNPGMGVDQPAIPSGAKKEDTGLFDQTSPYLEYGDFNMNDDENDDSLYFQYGRFFGVSMGLGYQTALGNRGKLYEAALPRLDLRVMYWFTFNFGMDLGIFFANHSFTNSDGNNTQVKMIGYGMHLKYYFDVRDSSAALTFANPFLAVGIGAMSKSESTIKSTEPESDSTLSMDFGGGFEFPVSYKKTYFILELLYHTQNFKDSIETLYEKRGITDLNGGFLTLVGHFMFVW